MIKHLFCRSATLLIVSAIFPGATALHASELSPAKLYENELIERYNTVKPYLDNNEGGHFYLQSSIGDKHASGDVYALVERSFKQSVSLFNSTQDLCNAIALHINVKTCAADRSQLQTNGQLKIYLGEEYYEELEDSFEFDYRVQTYFQGERHLVLTLVAKQGPLDSKNYAIKLHMLSLESNLVFLHFHYSAEFGAISNALLSTYLATFGRNKVGFTRTNPENSGSDFIKGRTAFLERSAMRYYFALRAYLDVLAEAPRKRFALALSRWHAFTVQYKDQLFELDLEDYIHSKNQEHINQLELQLAMTRLNGDKL